MSKKLSPGWGWTAKERQFLRKMAKEGVPQSIAVDRLNYKFYRGQKRKRTPSAVANQVRDFGIKFNAHARGIRTKLVITKKIEMDVRKRLLSGETKVAIAEAYSDNSKIPLTQFRVWLSKQTSRAKHLGRSGATPVAILENIFNDMVGGASTAQLSGKYKKTTDAISSLMNGWRIRRQKLMTDIVMGVSAHDIRIKYGLSIPQLAEFRKLARRMDFGDDEAELSSAPIWTKEEMAMALESITTSADTMRALSSEKRHDKYEIETDLDYITLLCSGDWHLESMYTDQRALKAACETVANTDGVYIGFCGDMLDGGIAAGPHKDVMNDAASSIKVARAAVRGLFFKIRYKLAWINTGCHVQWTISAADYNPYEEIAKELKVPYLGPGGTIDIKVNDITYRGGVMHKYPGGNLQLTAPCKNYLSKADGLCDFVAVGHNHINAIGQEDWQGKSRVLVRTGSYKDLDAYAKRLGFKGQETHTPPCIVFGTKTKEMHPFKSLEVGIRTMKAWNRGTKE